MINTVCRYFFWFMLYSFGGWIMETVLYLIRDKKVVKRGFLFGPLCPIYGFGAIISTALIYGRINNIFLVFIAGFFLCGALEYITHFVMEKLFHAMWWDYSNRRFNINGRVYLNGLLTFGAGVVLIIKVIQPLVIKLTDMIDDTALYIICFVLYSIVIMDAAATVEDLKGAIKALKGIQETIIGNVQKGVDLTEEQIEKVTSTVKNSEYWKKYIDNADNNKTFNKLKRSYPYLTFQKYKYLLDIILDKPIEEKARTDIKLYGTAETIPHKEESNEN